MTDGHEKRQHPRSDLILKVNYTSPGDFLVDYASNASIGGLFISTTRELSKGELLTFDISFPGLLEPIRCHGEVRWRRPPDNASDSNPAGIGVAFIFKNDEQKQAIQDLVTQLTQAIPQTEQKKPPTRFRVLVAEDNPLVREMLRFGLKKFQRQKDSPLQNLDVLEAENGGTAWELLQREPINLAIIDHYMPVMEGGKLVQLIRKDKHLKELPVIMVSGGGQEAREVAYQSGADLFLDKPVLLGNLLKSLGQLLSFKNQN